MIPFTIQVYNSSETLLTLHASGNDIDSVCQAKITELQQNPSVIAALQHGSLMVTITNEKDISETMTQMLS